MERKDYGYKCLNCGKPVEIDLQKAKKIICPYCGYRILEKRRPSIGRKVKAK
ncbi:MAG: DNA-directed RNA polymerase subunit P [Candidatus Aenigmarchaeota archaeon]|nr:DNA-directed RNA polymerase subunit P [Candidatus Aenigmarchaeota archaeon]